MAVLVLTMGGATLAEDSAAELTTILQKARSRASSLRIDEAVDLFEQATTMLGALRESDLDSATLADLTAKYERVAADLEKKVVQRAERDVNPMVTGLEAALRAGDAARVSGARDALRAAVEKHRRNLVVAGGASGAALLARAEELLAQEAAGSGDTPPTDEPAPPAVPETGDDPKSIHDEIQRRFRGARSLDTAALVEEAEVIRVLIERLRAADPDHPRLADFAAKVDKMVADAYARGVREARNEIERAIHRIEMYLENDDPNERPQLREQRDRLARALETYDAALEAGGEEGRELRARTLAKLEEVDARIGSALAGDALVDSWLERLALYNRGGAKDITPGINGAALYAKVSEWRQEALALWEEYEKVEFPGGKGPDLERLERFFQESLEESARQLAYAVTSRHEAAREQVDRIEAYFEADRGWKTDPATPPRRFADELLDAARLAIEDLAAYAPDHEGLAALRADHARLLAENTERREAAKGLTFLKPHRYAGADAEALLAYARTLVPRDHEGAKALRVTIFTPEWKQETVVEWTDSTRTALRVRTTRTLMFCVALEDGEGVFRDFGYLNQDRTADGAWGATYGHCARYRAPMLEENVSKDESE
jgi:hypothetical protein